MMMMMMIIIILIIIIINDDLRKDYDGMGSVAKRKMWSLKGLDTETICLAVNRQL
jgi:hypothetical protein